MNNEHSKPYPTPHPAYPTVHSQCFVRILIEATQLVGMWSICACLEIEMSELSDLNVKMLKCGNTGTVQESMNPHK